jgi:aspartate carbamoyltransferase catalytic subunit
MLKFRFLRASCPAQSRLAIARGHPDLYPDVPWRETRLRHVVDSKEFTRECLDLVFDVAEEMETVKPGTAASKQLEGYCMATLFYEPSTRTRLSFEAAMGKLGGVILSTESAGQFSSAAKGETLEGTGLKNLTMVARVHAAHCALQRSSPR